MEDALARKERLKALKQAAELADGSSVQEDTRDPEKPVIKFRNYTPRDEKLEHEKIAPAQPPKFEEPVIEPAPAVAQEAVVNIAPKKANWDLKREVEPILEKLERKTQRALVELMQEEERRRLADEGGIAD